MPRQAIQEITKNPGPLFIPFGRIDEERREVWGVATRDMFEGQPAIDTYGTVIDYDASKCAWERWSKASERISRGLSKGNVREMHQKIAAGRVLQWAPNDKERAIEVGTGVSDDGSWRKVKDGTLTGFSIGMADGFRVRMEERGGKRVPVIHDYDMVELSLVDSSSTPETQFTVIRMAAGGKPEVLPPLQAAAESIKLQQQAHRQAVTEHKIAQVDALLAPPAPTAGPAAAPVPASTPAAPAVPVASAASAPVVPQPVAAAAPAPAAEVPAAPVAAVTPVPVAAPAPVAVEAGRRVVQALTFDAAYFPSETGKTADRIATWLRERRFRVPKEIAPAVDGAIAVPQRAAAAFKAESLATVDLETGVRLTTGVLQVDPGARLLARLHTGRAAIERMAKSESGSMFPALQALGALLYAIDSEIWSTMPGESMPDEERRDIEGLTAACEAILEFIGAELVEQLSSVTMSAQTEAESAMGRFATIRSVLSPAQLERLATGAESAPRLATMHELGHRLVTETTALRAPCTSGACAAPRATERAAEPVAAPPAAAAAPSPTPSTAPAPTPATGERAVAPQASGSSGSEVMQAVAQVAEQVRDFGSRLASVDATLVRLGSAPAPIGRPPAAPVDKTIAGAGLVQVPDASVALERMAQAETNPIAKEALLKAAAEITIKGLPRPGARQ